MRGDVADVALAGILFAPHYAQAMPMSCIASSTPLRIRAGDDAEMVSELLYGETFQLLDVSGGWAWGYCDADHYVGYVRQDALGPLRVGGWRIAVPLTTTSIGEKLTMGALIDGAPGDGAIETPLGSIPLDHAVAADDFSADPVAVAERFLGAPYLLGGRTVRGIDCSGLVQLACAMSGRELPRDSDLQAEALGAPLAIGAPLRRGDFVCFPGHIGLMADETHMIHATAHSGNVIVEPLAAVAARTEPALAFRP